MTFNEYEVFCASTAVYPKEKEMEYLGLAITEEAGEVAGKLKKILRGDVPLDLEQRTALLKECGDVLYYVTRMTNFLGCSLEEMAEMNRQKILTRVANGTIKGVGDNR